MSYRLLGVAGAFSAALLLISAPMVQAQCVSGSITSAMETTGPYAGLYKYTVNISWDTPQGLSHATLDCGFGQCPGAACASGWFFEAIAGTGPGEGGCNAEYSGEFNCDGDPSIGMTDPVIKWDATGSNGCEPANIGSATLYFYTAVAPVPGVLPVVLVKNGQNVCSGNITGDCPLPCVVPVERSAWGTIKALFSFVY